MTPSKMLYLSDLRREPAMEPQAEIPKGDVENGASAATVKQPKKRNGWKKLKIISDAVKRHVGWVVGLILIGLSVYFILLLSTEVAVLNQRVESLEESVRFLKSAKHSNESTIANESFEQLQTTTIKAGKNGPQTIRPSSSANEATNSKMNSLTVGLPEKPQTNANKPNDEGLKQHTKKDKDKESTYGNAF